MNEVSDRRSQGAAQLRMLVDAYMSVQRERLRNANRGRAIEQGADTSEDKALWANLEARFQDIEDILGKEFLEAVNVHPVGPYLLSIKGIGPILAGKMIGLIGDATEFATVSKLWRYAGLAVIKTCENGHPIREGELCPECESARITGKAERLTRGEKAHFDKRLKTTMYNVGGALLKADSPYRAVYDEAYQFYMANRPDWSSCVACKSPIRECRDPEKHKSPAARQAKRGWNTGHVHLAAMRKMNKVLLSNLWEAWYRVAGKPIPSTLYVESILGHSPSHIYHPERFSEFVLPRAA